MRDSVAGARQKSRILVVEDEWFVAVENEATLRDARYDVVGVAMNGDEAIRIADRTRPDLVLMDIRLHGERDGIEIATFLHRTYGISCLFVTAHSDAFMRARGALAKPRGWLVKPFSARQLIEAVEAALTPES